MRSSASSNSASGMSFWEHLDVLRGVLIRAALLVLLLAVVLFVLMPQIFDSVILAPCRDDFPVFRLLGSIADADSAEWLGNEPVQLINTDLTSQFMLHISTSFWLAFILSVPVLIYMIWRFVSPGLYLNERRPARVVLTLGGVMFFCGVAMSYFIVFPLTLRFLSSYQLSASIPNIISIDSYMDTMTGLCIVMGLVFELPMLTWLLGRVGIVTRSLMVKYRRHAIVALLVLAAVITPTGDPFTLLVVFAPLYLLWEASTLLLPKSTDSEESSDI